MKVLYFHGVPFFNSWPEKNLLQSRFQDLDIDLKLWNESTNLVLRENAFETYLKSAEQFLFENYSGEPVILLGHSFGSHPACYLAQKHPDKVTKIVLIAPDLDLASVDIAMFTVVMNDYKKHGDDRWLGLQEVLKNFSPKFNQNSEVGFGLVAQNPRLFDYFWSNKERMGSFLQFYAAPGCGIDIDSYFVLRNSHPKVHFSNSQVPAVAIFGKNDQFISRGKELVQLWERFSSVDVYEMEDSGHYPHIEETDKFLGILRQLNLASSKIEQDIQQHTF